MRNMNSLSKLCAALAKIGIVWRSSLAREIRPKFAHMPKSFAPNSKRTSVTTTMTSSKYWTSIWDCSKRTKGTQLGMELKRKLQQILLYVLQTSSMGTTKICWPFLRIRKDRAKRTNKSTPCCRRKRYSPCKVSPKTNETPCWSNWSKKGKQGSKDWK